MGSASPSSCFNRFKALVCQYGPKVTIALALNESATVSGEKISLEMTMLPGSVPDMKSVDPFHCAFKLNCSLILCAFLSPPPALS